MNMFKKVYNWFFNKNISPIIIPDSNIIDSLNIDESYVCEISFQLTKDNDIDIGFKYSDVREYSVEQISTLAENCANMMVLLNNGFLKKDLISTVKHIKKANMNNDKSTLLLDNVLFFNNLLQEELKSIRKENGPLIRPSAVFKSM